MAPCSRCPRPRARPRLFGSAPPQCCERAFEAVRASIGAFVRALQRLLPCRSPGAAAAAVLQSRCSACCRAAVPLQRLLPCCSPGADPRWPLSGPEARTCVGRGPPAGPEPGRTRRAGSGVWTRSARLEMPCLVCRLQVKVLSHGSRFQVTAPSHGARSRAARPMGLAQACTRRTPPAWIVGCWATCEMQSSLCL